MVEDVHLPQPFLQAGYILDRLPIAVYYVTLDFLRAVLTQIVDCPVVLKHLLTLVLGQILRVVL